MASSFFFPFFPLGRRQLTAYFLLTLRAKFNLYSSRVTDMLLTPSFHLPLYSSLEGKEGFESKEPLHWRDLCCYQMHAAICFAILRKPMASPRIEISSLSFENSYQLPRSLAETRRGEGRGSSSLSFSTIGYSH
jgi:hypothetical protein